MFRIAISAVTFLVTIGVAAAQPRLDTDGDGAVSLDELRAARPQVSAERFDAADADGNGVLSADELRAMRGYRRPGRRALERLDADGDGSISLPEIQAVRPDVSPDAFNRADADGNGYLSPVEMRAMRRDRNSQRAPRQGRRGPPAELDTDGDGAVSLDELRAVRPGVTEEAFERMDRNGDGVISPDERRRRGHRPRHDRPDGSGGADPAAFRSGSPTV